MKRRTLTIGLLLIAVGAGLIGALSTSAQRQPQPQNPAPANYAFSGPYTHKNLTIFLLHGADQSRGPAPLTLQEAMRQKKVIVRETGDVNELTIQNRSNQEVFVQAGDIVKGGQQDRVLALDLIVPARSGRIPIEAFCVEQGRWSRRGNEAVAAFSASNNMLASKELKIAAKAKGSQDEVWENVSKAQAKLAQNVVVVDSAPATAGASRGASRSEGAGLGQARAVELSSAGEGIEMRAVAGLTAPSVVSAASPSSLQLTLENKLVKDTANDYVKKLSSIVAGKRDVIGFVFAINGQLNSADVYSSNALFKKLWPKMLEASAVEAVAELKADGKFEPVKKEAAQAFLLAAQDGKTETRNVAARTSVIKSETGKSLFFETRDGRRSDGWMHRNYLAK